LFFPKRHLISDFAYDSALMESAPLLVDQAAETEGQGGLDVPLGHLDDSGEGFRVGREVSAGQEGVVEEAPIEGQGAIVAPGLE
jgi:hypothetical protein